MFSRISALVSHRQYFFTQILARGCSTNSGEGKIKSILQQKFPKAKVIEVVDISGGCGAMYDITVEAPELKGLNIVKQHRMVNEALKEEIKDMHGLRINTSVPS
ncbi:bolA-like protein 3 [Frankliniella occidentalis]|uniref:BolA-like protein 3 n=1 Tax=Frankliniella occidentalis TaxID=133901 RepID=A0A6J1SV62_FRAOC|nr:bolA-like protein 3 [Frankliniella occidentalis]XP_026283210.1 bolA-like protein 3 [Frankliniella occidentalis]